MRGASVAAGPCPVNEYSSERDFKLTYYSVLPV
jgi:hypothetical protein